MRHIISETTGGRRYCMRCGLAVDAVGEECGGVEQHAPCPHLGDPIERDGVPITVKCGCSEKAQEKMLPVSRCAVHKRCLPTARFSPEQLADWSERPEAAIYQLCQTCTARQN